ncbi:hypothetical protein [Gordonia sp. OPL2]|uniref:hypothetical protein n=1 Tax=Gordonia sp. OPL2 TaxID=2486274 RepID=UPI00165663F9|nr:hypothetical protein [Gordonia sp. OPL2]
MTTDVSHRIYSMGPDGAWRGQSHDAAVSAVDQGEGSANTIKNVAISSVVGIEKYAPALVESTNAITGLVRIIESGDLYVTDDWTVLVREKMMSPAMAKLMMLAAMGFQDQLNPHLMALGHADHDLGNFIRSQIKVMAPDLPELWDDRAAPQDVTTDPYSDERRGENPTTGREEQQRRLAEHMMGTVVDKSTTTENGKTVTTLRMLDGSRQEYTDAHRGGVGDEFAMYSDKGILVSTRVTNADGSTTTTLMRAGKSPVVVTEYENGRATAVVDGVSVQVPGSREVAQALAGGGMAALEPHVAEGLPYLTPGQAETLKLGAKAAGPALTILGTAVAVASAKSGYDQCVAGTTGAVSLVGDLGLAAIMPESFGPMRALGATTLGTLMFGTIGSAIGQAVCK